MAAERQRERAAATQQQLLEAAREVFSERGYQGTSVAAITDAASTAHGTFYLYFRNKEDVFAQLTASAMEELYRQTLMPFDPSTHVYDPALARARVAMFMKVAVEHRLLWRALLEASLVSPVIAEQWLGHRRRLHDGLVERLTIFQARGEFRDADPDLVVTALASMLEWVVFTSASFEVPGPLVYDEAFIDTIADLWDRALDIHPGAAGS